MVCDAVPHPTRNVLSYTAAAWDNVVAMVAANVSASVCVAGMGIWHGTYDFGANPSVAAVRSVQDKVSKKRARV
jgi:hypothetical protein